MAYLYGERRQGMLFPASLEEYIAADDPVRVYDAFVEQLDFTALGITIDPEQVGPPAYDPKAMLKLLVYGYSYGIRSSRKLEQAVYHNLSFIWLVGGLKPDHKTIAKFRRENLDALQKVLRQCVRMCLNLNLIAGNTLFVDGTKIRANASLNQNLNSKQADRLLGESDQRIAALLSECEVCDQAEAGQESLVHLQRKLSQAKSRRSKIRSALREFKGGDQKAINLTDPDCRVLKGRQGIIAGYNMQTVVDDQNGLIVHTEVVNDANDLSQFVPQIESAHEALGGKCRTACGDSGYANTSSLKSLEEQGIVVIVPSQEQALRHPKENPFGKERFVYDPERDGYTCPQGHWLRYRKTDWKVRQITYQITKPSICRECPHFGACTESEQGRSIVRLVDEELKERLEARFETDSAQEIFRRRKALVEHPFGHLKENLGVRAFLLRGFMGVRAEAKLLAVVINLKRMISIIGVRKLMISWKTT